MDIGVKQFQGIERILVTHYICSYIAQVAVNKVINRRGRQLSQGVRPSVEVWTAAGKSKGRKLDSTRYNSSGFCWRNVRQLGGLRSPARYGGACRAEARPWSLCISHAAPAEVRVRPVS